jgi:hypothetical protein
MRRSRSVAMGMHMPMAGRVVMAVVVGSSGGHHACYIIT